MVETQNQENEMKLVGGYNNQLKYSDCSKEDTLDKIMTILDVLEIQHGGMKPISQCDKYYDTDDGKILRKKGCVRIREKKTEEKEEVLLTVKTRDERSTSLLPDSLIRKEDESPISIKEVDEELRKVAREKFNINEKILPQLLVNNQRHSCEISTGVNKYELSYDKFTYINLEDNSESNDYYEIEIELEQNKVQQGVTKEDQKILNLAVIFKGIMGFTSDKKSKYERGIEWKEKNVNFIHRIFVVVDMVEYSINNSVEQRRKAEKLTSIVKKQLTGLGRDYDIFPMGDGMIVSVPENVNVLPFVHRIFGEIQQFNAATPKENHIYLRASIHEGSVVPYTDINGRKNYAGQGINIAYRINSLTERNQILVSENFYQCMKERNKIDDEAYSKKAEVIVKHGERIEVRNFADGLIGISMQGGI